MSVDVEQARRVWAAALDSKPSKGDWNLADLIEAACLVPELLDELVALRAKNDPTLVRQCYCPGCATYHDTRDGRSL